MSMHNFSCAGPIFAGMAATSEPSLALQPDEKGASVPVNDMLVSLVTELTDHVANLTSYISQLQMRIDIVEKAVTIDSMIRMIDIKNAQVNDQPILVTPMFDATGCRWL